MVVVAGRGAAGRQDWFRNTRLPIVVRSAEIMSALDGSSRQSASLAPLLGSTEKAALIVLSGNVHFHWGLCLQGLSPRRCYNEV